MRSVLCLSSDKSGEQGNTVKIANKNFKIIHVQVSLKVEKLEYCKLRTN